MSDPQTANVLSGDQPQEKTAKQLEKEAKKAAKLEKLQAKLEKKTSAPVVSKEKPEKKAKEVKSSAVYTVATAPGEKKDVSGPMPDSYSPQFVEAAWYAWWEKQGFFKPEYGRKSILDPNPKGKFVMVIPPPNVTGSLHLGHALTNSVEDAITRWHRMSGRTTLWNPGCDHAGIATQVVVEKKLWREEKKTRHDLGREEFIKRVWDWKNEKGVRIYEQLRALGSSVDWDRARFTMDPSMCRAVTEAFIRLHDAGDVYRASRLVNWSCALKSAISDIEVDKMELPGRTMLDIPGYDHKVEFGVLVLFAYKVSGSSEELVVATTRIETMLGDSAVCVHPADARYRHLVGKTLRHPFCERALPVVADEYVDMQFGTGAVKITPAHDPNDYEIGKRHSLPFITMLDDAGLIAPGYGRFSGMRRFDCRREIVQELEKLGLYRETKSHAMVVPLCSRSKDVVEPMLKPQWYIRCDGMAREAIKAVKSGELKIIPEVHEKIWYHWMEGIRDWCISRQLWWGHRIPAYRVTVTGAEQDAEAMSSVATPRKWSRSGRRKSKPRPRRPRPLAPPTRAGDEEVWVSAHSEADARAKAALKLRVPADKLQLAQDPDVLDTWFSAGLFPFAVFGWPDDTDDLKAFYPGTLLETGHDILFFWVARMVFFGQRLMGKLPFKEVYLHPMVRDAHGRKMSKSLGNVVDPCDVVRGVSLAALHAQLDASNLDARELERARLAQSRDYPDGIPECGTDALRFGLCAMTSGRDLNLDILRVQGYRFFCNKLWNATKFALLYFPSGETYSVLNRELPPGAGPVDKWMASRIACAAHRCNLGFQHYDLPSATTACYNLWLYDLCDVYLEYLKPVLAGGSEAAKRAARRVLYTALELGLTLLSPFMPFVTEELYQRLPRASAPGPSICVAPYPTEETVGCWRDEALEGEVETAMRLVHMVRSSRADYGLGGKQRTAAHLVTGDTPAPLADRLKALLRSLSGLCNSEICEGSPPAGCAILTHSDQIQVHLVLKGLIDPTKEIAKIEKKKEQLGQTISKLNQAMAAEDYSTKVPAEVQAANADKLAQSTGEVARLEAAIESLKLM